MSNSEEFHYLAEREIREGGGTRGKEARSFYEGAVVKRAPK